MSNKYNDPVVWYDGKKFYVSQEAASMCLADMITLKPLYAAPPKREPLSVEEILRCPWDSKKRLSEALVIFSRALEAKHGIGGQS